MSTLDMMPGRAERTPSRVFPVSEPVVARVTEATPATSAGDDYENFCACFRELTGLDLTLYKRPQMERRLRTFYTNRGVGDLNAACHEIRHDPQALVTVMDRVTINVSQLWRNPEQWQLIEDELLPELFAATNGRTMTAWSAGCSYGAEAYTLASICRHVRPGGAVTIQGTDIDKRMVERARLGVFSKDDARDAPSDALSRDFERTAEGWRARPEIRQLTHFEVGDLLRARIAARGFDLILCRNTVIYFAEKVRDELHARLAAGLRSGGYLVVGATERVSDPKALDLTAAHPFIYRKA